MSRIGKKSIAIPEGVTITVGKANVVTVKGKNGELKQAIDRDISVEIKDGHVSFGRPTDQIRHRAMHGLYRALVAGAATDGQILVLYDILDITSGRKPRFVKYFVEGAGNNLEAMRRYVRAVKDGSYPGPDHGFA